MGRKEVLKPQTPTAKAKRPSRWWGLFCANDLNPHPEAVFWSQDKSEVRMWAQQHPEHVGFLEFVEGYDPRLTIVAEFRPDADAQVRALRTLIDYSGRGEK